MKEQMIKCIYCGRKFSPGKAISRQVEEAIRKERENVRKEEKQKAIKAAETKVKGLEGKLQKAQRAEANMRKELEKQRKTIEQDEKRKAQQEWQTRVKEIQDKHSREIREEKKRRAGLTKKIEELEKKAKEGPPGIRGDVGEEDLEAALNKWFPGDDIKRVPKGRRGADILQTVYSKSRQRCGVIIWEAKRAKEWDNRWVEKLKDDQRKAKAEIAVLVSETLRRGISNFDALMEDFWVTDYRSVRGLSTALRIELIKVASERQLVQKAGDLCRYVTGTEFRQRVKAIGEAFERMRSDLEQEQKTIKRIWAKREKQIQRVIDYITTMDHNLEELRTSLPQVASLELKALSTGAVPGKDEP